MTQTELNERFEALYVEPLHKELQTLLEDDLEERYEVIKEDLIRSFRALVADLVANDKKVAYIFLHVTRSGLVDESNAGILQAYDESLYLDSLPLRKSLDLTWLYSRYSNYIGQLHQERKQFHLPNAKLGYLDVERIRLEKWESLISYVEIFIKSMAQDIVPLFEGVDKSDKFVICVGEYMGVSEPVWVEDMTPKEDARIKEILVRFLFRGQGLHYKLNGDSYLGKYHSDFFYSTMLNGKQVGLMKSDDEIVMGKFKSVLKYSKKLVGKEYLLFLFSLLTLDKDRNQIGEYSLAQTSYSKILFDKHKNNVQWIPD